MTNEERGMKDADFDYLRNINTRPGPGAGHSIDPTKPGPDDVLPREHQDPSKWVSRETMERAHAAQSDAEHIAFLERQRGLYEMNEADAAIVSDIDEELARLRGEVTPSGRVTETWAKSAHNTSSHQRDYVIETINKLLKQPDAEPVAQSNAEPVAWRYKYKGERGEDPGDWFLADKQEIAALPGEQIDVQPLYTAPPRPDASAGMSWSGFNVYGDKKSINAVRDALHAKDRCEALDRMIAEKQLVRPDTSAGLIEAAEWLEANKNKFGASWSYCVLLCAKSLRIRAADRSEK